MKDNIQGLKNIFIQLDYILDEQQKRGAIAVVICMVLGTAMELMGVSSIYPFLQIMLDADALQEKWYIKWIKGIYPDISLKSLLILIGIVIIIIYIVKNLFLLLSTYVQNAYAARLRKESSVKMLDSYLQRPYQYFLNTNSSVIIRGIGVDIAGVYQILLNCFTIIAEIINIIALAIFLLMTDWFISFGALLLALLCFLGIVIGFKGKIKRAGQDMRHASALRSQYSYQAISGIKEITVLDRRACFVDQFEEAAGMEEKATLINGFVAACPDRILEGACIAGFMTIVCIKIAIGTNLDGFIPVLGTFAMGAFRILPSISKVSSRLNSIIFYKPCLQSTYDNIREIREGYKTQENGSENPINETLFRFSDVVPQSMQESISFENVLEIKDISWKYLNAKENVLEKLNLTIHKGEAVAFIGSSGAGKTTLADIIMGLLKPQSGTVKLDGRDIFSMPHQWAKIIGYVPQSVFLIDDTIRSNVAFGLRKDLISDDKIWIALEQAQLKGFVENLPDGLDTIVGERGVKFSGGQRQRIAIARALYEDPDILIMDEATSALDNETEAAVMDSIDALQGNKTLIIVAHRLTTIRNCDKIYEIKNGVAIERNKEDVFE